MPDEKPVHIGKERYPELVYPNVIPATATISSDGPEESEVHLLEYWRVIVARKWTVLAILMTTVTGTLIWTLKQTPVYRAQATIQIDRETPNILDFRDAYQIDFGWDDSLRTQFEVLKSRALARRVIQDLRLDEHESFRSSEPSLFGAFVQSLSSILSKPDPVSPVSNVEPDALRPLIQSYLVSLQVAPLRQARIATVSFESTDAELAARVVNAHANHFIEQNFENKWEATQQASDFLSKQLLDLKAKLEQSEDRLQAYSRDNQILFTDEGSNTATEKLQQLEEEYTRALGERFQRESYDRLIRAGNTDALPQLMNNVVISTLTSQISELYRERSELEVTFNPEYPRLQRTLNKIAEYEKGMENERARVVRTIQAEYRASVEREKLLDAALQEQRNIVNRINQEIIQYNIMKREVESNKQLYDGLLNRLKQAGVSAGLRASNIRVVDRAEIPRIPISPRKTLSLILSLAGGLVLGVGLALFQHYMDDSIKSTDDVQRYMRLPILGMVPKLRSIEGRASYGNRLTSGSRSSETALARQSKLAQVDTISHSQPSSVMAEAYRSIRTSLLLSSPGHPPKSVLITSALPSEGKTVTAVNTAISLTQTGARVVLVDADMRKPRVHVAFGMPNTMGLSSFLTGSAQLKDVIQPSEIPGLFVLPCGPTPPNPAELILSNGFRQALKVLHDYFDYVVMDSPPISNVSDARILASACESTILVVKACSTPRHYAVRSVEYLIESRAKLSGVVLNDLDLRGGSGYYAYYTSYSTSYSRKPDSAA